MNDWALRKSWIYKNPMKSESSCPGPVSSHHDGESNRIQEEHGNCINEPEQGSLWGNGHGFVCVGAEKRFNLN